MARGNAGGLLFQGDGEFQQFLEILGKVKAHSPFELYAYCLMSNHIHLLVRVNHVPLASLMRRLLTGWAKRFNLPRQRNGHVFQGRYKAILCRDDAYLIGLLRYIHMNPVEAGLVEHPRDWPWSGHREYILQASSRLIDRGLLHFFGGKDPILGYERFVLSYVNGELEKSHPDCAETEPPLFRREEAQRPSLEWILEAVCGKEGIKPAALLGKGRARALSSARRSFLHAALQHGYAMVELSKFLGISPSGVSRAIRLKTQQSQRTQ